MIYQMRDGFLVHAVFLTLVYVNHYSILQVLESNQAQLAFETINIFCPGPVGMAEIKDGFATERSHAGMQRCDPIKRDLSFKYSGGVQLFNFFLSTIGSFA